MSVEPPLYKIDNTSVLFSEDSGGGYGIRVLETEKGDRPKEARYAGVGDGFGL